MSQQPQQRQVAQSPMQQQPPVPRRFPTRSYLPPETRSASIDVLEMLLADTTILRTHAKTCHWNVKGIDFFQLHELFDELAEVLADHEDTIAERAAALGGEVLGTARQAAATSSIPPLSRQATTGPDYVEELLQGMAIYDANLYEGIQRASAVDDPDTADTLNDVSRDVSKYRWFLESHLTTAPVGSAPAPQPSTDEAVPTSGVTTGMGQQTAPTPGTQ